MPDPNTPHTAANGDTNSSSALIIDDELDICYLLKQILSRHNIQTNRAGTLQEARTILHTRTHFDIIFLDNHLPDGLGIDFVREIRRQYPLTLLVMITAHDSDNDRKQASMNGVDIFIAKPFSREIIATMLSQESKIK